jgi:hypothetical protein
MATPTPTRKTNEDVLNEWNVKLRSSPVYQDFLKSQGIDPLRPVGLSRSQQGALEHVLEANGMKIPGGMHIDNAGNLNQKNRLARNTAIAAGIAAGGYFAAPYIAGALGAGAGGAGGIAAGVPTGLGGLTVGGTSAALGGVGAGAAGIGAAGLGAGVLAAGVPAGLGALTVGGVPAAVGGVGAGSAGLGAGTAGLGATAAGGLSTAGKLAAMSGKIGQASQVAGAMSAANAQGRAQESQLLDARDRTATDRYQTEQAAQMSAGQQDLERKGFTEQARGSRAKQAAIADMLANFKGTQITIPGIQSATTTGGLQVGSPGVQQAMGKLREQALLAQLQGDAPGGENFQGGKILKPAAMSDVPHEGGYSKLLGIASGLGSMAGAYGMKKTPGAL